MKAMQFEKSGQPLNMVHRPQPQPGPGQLLLEVLACGVCRTDLHIIDNELSKPKLPLIIGHEIVGRVAALGKGVNGFSLGQRVGVPWVGKTCGVCKFCLSSRENLCDNAQFTGYDIDGGYATQTLACAEFCFPLEECELSNEELAPLLCAGLIGWRTLKLAGEGKRIGIYGFGAAAYIIIQVALYQGREVYAFTKKGDRAGQDYAKQLGAHWAGSSDERPPEVLDAALIFAPAGELVPLALKPQTKALQ